MTRRITGLNSGGPIYIYILWLIAIAIAGLECQHMTNSPVDLARGQSAGVGAIPFIPADLVSHILPARTAIDSLVNVLVNGFDPTRDSARSSVALTNGELLIMPSQTADFLGTKLLTIASGTIPTSPRVQGVYVLFDGGTLSPVAILDGIALTSLRTPAVSLAVALPALELDSSPLDVVVFGDGPQGVSHIELLLASIRGRIVRSVTYVTQSGGSREQKRERITSIHLINGDQQVEDSLRVAGLVICATTSQTPLFDSRLLSDNVVVVAVGSHDPSMRELDGQLMGRAIVVVEDVETALREAGDILLAIKEGNLTTSQLVSMSTAVHAKPDPNRSRPLVFKTTGMAWEDLVIASTIYSTWRENSQ